MRRSSPCGNAGHAIDGAPVRHQVRRACAPCKRQNGPAFAGPFCVKGKRRESEGRPLSPPGMRRSSPCGRTGLAIDGAPVRRQVRSKRALCKRQNGPAFAGSYRAKGKWRESGGRPLSPPGMRRSSPCGNAGHAIDGAPVARSEAPAPFASRKNGPAFAGPFCVKGKRRGSGGRSPSPGRWTRPAPASRPGRRRSRTGGHPRRQSR